MSEKSFHRASLYFLGFITLAIWSILIWDYFHGGVPSHHLLAKKELPEVSNWWGAIFIPLATYLSLNSIKKRLNFTPDVTNQSIKKQFLLPFIVSFLYAVVIAVSFSSGNAQISGVLFQALFIIALFFPIYQAAYFLGFVLGLTYTFGGVLPIIIGLFLGGISYLLFYFIRPGFKWLATKLGVLKTHP